MITIAFEGIDACGKETQVELLEKELALRGYSVQVIAFPRYETEVGKIIKAVLKGDIEMSDKAFHMLQAVDKQDFERDIVKIADSGVDILILDRFTLSNVIYATSKGIDVRWIDEIQSKTPDIDLTIVLGIPVEESVRRRPIREDLHESNLQLLEDANMYYEYMCGTSSYSPYGIIKAINGMGTIDEVHRRILDVVTATINSNHTGI